MSTKQGTKAGARGAAKMARRRATERAAKAKATAAIARRRASDTAAQFSPLAESAKMSASRGAYRARRWAAPRLDQAGHAVQERIAPGVAGMLSSAARRIEPARSRRRWPIIMGGLAMLAGAASAVAVVLGRRGQAGGYLAQESQAASAGAASSEQAATSGADVNGQVRTP